MVTEDRRTLATLLEQTCVRIRARLMCGVAARLTLPVGVALVSGCELLKNVVIGSKPKALLGLSQKARSRMSRLTLGARGHLTAGE